MVSGVTDDSESLFTRYSYKNSIMIYFGLQDSKICLAGIPFSDYTYETERYV